MKRLFFAVALAAFLTVPSVANAQCFQYRSYGSCQYYYQRPRLFPRLFRNCYPVGNFSTPRSACGTCATRSASPTCSDGSCSVPTEPEPSCENCEGGSCEYVPSEAGNIPVEDYAQRRTLIDRLNATRARFRLPALAFDQSLESGASIQAGICSRSGRLVHAYGVAEILAQNSSDFNGAVAQWLNSPAHRALLLSGSFRSCGIGIVRDGYGRSWYAVQFR